MPIDNEICIAESPYTFPLQRADSALGWVTTAGDYLRFITLHYGIYYDYHYQD